MIKRTPQRFYQVRPNIYSKPNIPSREELLVAFDNNDYDKFVYFKSFGPVNELCEVFMYCVINNDEEFLNKVIEKHNDYKFLNYCGSEYDILQKCSKNIINILFNKTPYDIDKLESLANIAIYYDNIHILNKLQSVNYKLVKDNLVNALFVGSIEYLKSIIHLYDDIQKIFDDYYRKYQHARFSLEKIEYLVNNNINILEYSNLMMPKYIEWQLNDNVIYLYELGETDIKQITKSIIITNNIDLLIYFLKQDIVFDIDKIYFIKPNYEMIKILLDNEYVFNEEIKQYIIIRSLNNSDIINIEKIFDLFGDIILNINNNYASILENIIFNNKMEHIKFIIKHSNEILDIKKLFIIACCNGRIEIAKLLLDINDDVDYDFAFDCATYLGHYDMVSYLLKYDINLDESKLWLCIYGDLNENAFYSKILEKYDIKSDMFIYGCKFDKIIKLFLDMGIKMTFEMFDKIRFSNYDMSIIYHMVDNGIDINKIFERCCKTCYYGPIPDKIKEILKYLLDNGANPNVGDFCDNDVIKFLEDYKNSYL